MNDIRRTILWVIFGFSMVLLWDKWQVHNGHKATFFPSPAAVTASAPEGGASAAQPAARASTPAAAPAGAAQVPGGEAPAPVARERVTVTSDVLRLEFDGQGGSLVHGELLKYPAMEDKAKPFVLFDDSASRVYQAQTGLIGGAFPTH